VSCRRRPVAAIILLIVLAGGPPALAVCEWLCGSAATAVERTASERNRSDVPAECHATDASPVTGIGAAHGHPCGDHDSATTSLTASLTRGRAESMPDSSTASAGHHAAGSLAQVPAPRPTGASPPVSPPRPLASSQVLRI
jgi:hypothetical protein